MFSKEALRDKYEGYCIDLLEEMANEEGFDYEIFLNPENSNGKLEANGTRNGLIRDLIDSRADMAISDLTITQDRAKAV
ncbi:glutamate receptor ionotropic: kainate 3-like protein [Dinothrombium tinctorium]|uniref:Glutamate receptor ionotropic: kainate 3-like protein n=1 Tax=Dinothrombium tinctorium TaxID=1965070 RepID=A0A3S3NG49_9ACAR|nr:glutamate receptor ionotropic: kainate 3-like protein [Dinothrombium tinctorium]